jgi:uncharacterized protein (DUF305 family)
MTIPTRAGRGVLLLAAAILVSCTSAPRDPSSEAQRDPSPEAQQFPPTPRAVHPGAPGEESRTLGPAELAAIEGPRHTEADVRFMRMMIAHHRQALEMTALVRERTSREDIQRMAWRMDVSQADEIDLMERWLTSRGETSPEPDHPHAAHGPHGHSEMPGLLTPEQMAHLAEASGPAFDRLFLEYMIFHHEGAILMAEELFATPGAGQEGEVYQFASHVEADQRIEIERMRRMLADDSDR